MTKIIIRDMDGHVQHDATGCFDIVIGDGTRRLNVSISKDGWVQVRAMEGDLEVRPQANNTLLVRTLPYMLTEAHHAD
jgi:hypothetical protein